MTHSVGLRQYKIIIQEKNSKAFIDPSSSTLQMNFPNFLTDFIAQNAIQQNEKEVERSWKFKEILADLPGCSRGWISYGVYGFASRLEDGKTGELNYQRKRDDNEVIDLYYRYWLPEFENFVLVSFQSFSGRSCITLVLSAMQTLFEKQNPHHRLIYSKLLPSDATGKIYEGKPVKNLRLVSRNPKTDLAARFFGNEEQKTSRMSVTVNAGRGRSFGILSEMLQNLPPDSNSVITHNGIEFDEAIAGVKIGNKIRPIGVFGAHSDVGVVDVTEEIVKGDDDGHPTYESINKAADDILNGLYESLHGIKT